MYPVQKEAVPSWLRTISNHTPEENLQLLANALPNGVTFSTSFSLEDQVITHIIASRHIPIKIFTLDTGRLFSATYQVWTRTLQRYAIDIQTYHPDKKQLEAYTTRFGPDAFYQSVDLRKQCCHIRKVAPLGRALKDKKVWVTGVRQDHSANRAGMQPVEWDEANGLIKYHPLFYWSQQQVAEYINTNRIPYNTLHDAGYVSIGCEPCTRAVLPGEDFRAGRWWWEEDAKKECGLHKHE